MQFLSTAFGTHIGVIHQNFVEIFCITKLRVPELSCDNVFDVLYLAILVQ